ncbi:MAG: agmatine deiminase family protein [Isosphaeraceae bacterium]
MTPAQLGYRMPAEWEPHEATWIAWPHNRDDWPGKFAPIPWVYTEIVRHLSRVEMVRIVVGSAKMERRACEMLDRAGANLERVRFLRARTDRVWLRDSGPTFLVRGGGGSNQANDQPDSVHLSTRPGLLVGSAVRTDPQPMPAVRTADPTGAAQGAKESGAGCLVDWKFNAWAKYPDHQNDNRIPRLIAAELRQTLWKPRFPVGGKLRRVVMEGGAIDVNGLGTLLATEECLLSEVQCRNPGLDRAGLEQVFANYLGVRHVIWLGRGIAGDDTHGHVDDLARFVDPRTVVTVVEPRADDPNHEPLQENLRRLEAARDQDGEPLRVLTLPMPAPVIFEAQRLPASYANFYIANGLVLVPTFNDPADRIALNTLAELFPDRQVVGIHCVDLVLGLGTLHCLTRQQPQ